MKHPASSGRAGVAGSARAAPGSTAARAGPALETPPDSLALPPPLSFDGALHVPLALFLASPPADIVEVLAAVPAAEVRRRQRRLREWAPAFDYWGGAGERGPAARAAERLCAGPVS